MMVEVDGNWYDSMKCSRIEMKKNNKYFHIDKIILLEIIIFFSNWKINITFIKNEY